MTSPLIPGTNWAVEPQSYNFYVTSKDGKNLPLYVSHSDRQTLEQFYTLILKDAYCDMWRTIAVGEPYTEIQCLMAENNIDFENNFIVVILDQDKNLVGKAKLSYPDKVDIIVSCDEGGGV